MYHHNLRGAQLWSCIYFGKHRAAFSFWNSLFILIYVKQLRRMSKIVFPNQCLERHGLSGFCIWLYTCAVASHRSVYCQLVPKTWRKRRASWIRQKAHVAIYASLGDHEEVLVQLTSLLENDEDRFVQKVGSCFDAKRTRFLSSNTLQGRSQTCSVPATLAAFNVLVCPTEHFVGGFVGLC